MGCGTEGNTVLLSDSVALISALLHSIACLDFLKTVASLLSHSDVTGMFLRIEIEFILSWYVS
jgi:hypothetical protein